MKRLLRACKTHSVIAVATVLVVLGILCTSLVIVAPPSWELDRVVASAAAIVTVAAFFIAIAIYLAERSDGNELSAELKREIHAALDAARAVRGESGETNVIDDSRLRSVKGQRVLWVDDRPENCVFEARALRDAGAEITFTLSTTAAKAALVASDFDLVISDMGRPEGKLAGYDLLTFVNQYAARTPFILYTSTASPDQVEDAQRRGALTQVADPWQLHHDATAALLASSASR